MRRVAVASMLRETWNGATGASTFGSHVALNIATNVVLAGLSMASGLLAARLLGPIGRGELAAIQNWPLFLVMCGQAGIPEALGYFAAREPANAGRWLTTAMVAATASVLPLACLAYFAMPYLLHAQSQDVVQSARTYLWLLPIMTTVGMLLHPLRGTNNIVMWNVLRPLPALAWLGTLLACAMLGWLNAGQVSRLYLLAFAAVGLPMGWVAFRCLPRRIAPDLAWAPRMLHYGIPTALSSIPSFMNLRMDQLLMAATLPSRLLGEYVVAVAWSVAVTPLVSGLTAAVLPRVAGSHNPDEQAFRCAQATRLGVILVTVASSLTAISAPLGIRVFFGAEYSDAVVPGTVLAVAAGLLALKDLLVAGAMGLGRPKYVLQSELVGLLVTAVSLMALLPTFLLVGAAVASLLGYGAVLVMIAFLVARHTRLPLRALLVPTREDIHLISDRLHAAMTQRRVREDRT